MKKVVYECGDEDGHGMFEIEYPGRTLLVLPNWDSSPSIIDIVSMVEIVGDMAEMCAKKGVMREDMAENYDEIRCASRRYMKALRKV